MNAIGNCVSVALFNTKLSCTYSSAYAVLSFQFQSSLFDVKWTILRINGLMQCSNEPPQYKTWNKSSENRDEQESDSKLFHNSKGYKMT